MTDKQMHKLSRRELLQLLLAQARETEDLRQQLADRENQLAELGENYERLRVRLDEKDIKIHDLRDALQEEKNSRRIRLQEAGSIAEAALRLNKIFDVAQEAADQYLENVKGYHDRLISGEALPVEAEEDLPTLEEEIEADHIQFPPAAWFLNSSGVSGETDNAEGIGTELGGSGEAGMEADASEIEPGSAEGIETELGGSGEAGMEADESEMESGSAEGIGTELGGFGETETEQGRISESEINAGGAGLAGSEPDGADLEEIELKDYELKDYGGDFDLIDLDNYDFPDDWDGEEAEERLGA
ncbi:MAG: hypothetical protein NC432_02325 [Roseburia sp.]|nr:hypothetical protein [Roseburia sp.]MCM1097472.1 hypothetical protein [Ruminococcus flavefaciens]